MNWDQFYRSTLAVGLFALGLGTMIYVAGDGNRFVLGGANYLYGLSGGIFLARIIARSARV